MGRAVVRSAIATYLTNANIPFLGTVYTSRPMVIDEADYERTMSAGTTQYAAAGSSAVLVVNLPDTERTRKSITGLGFVSDLTMHRVVLEVFFANTTGDAVAAQNDHDALVDAIVVALRADPLLGTAGSPIWEAGDDETPGVTVQQMEPYTSADGTTVLLPSLIRFAAFEWVGGAAGV